MDEIVGYIFKNLKNSENAIKILRKKLLKQTNFNRKTSMFIMLLAVNDILVSKKIHEYNKQIKQLGNEIEELKHSKGE